MRHIAEHYKLSKDARILDVGRAKGFMLHDFKQLMPEATIAGIDISQYAYDNALESVKPFLRVGDAKSLPFEDDSFDLVLGLSTVHNLPINECKARFIFTRTTRRITVAGTATIHCPRPTTRSA